MHPDTHKGVDEGKSEKWIVETMLDKIRSICGGDRIIAGFPDFVIRYRKDVFLYLENPEA